MKQNHDNRLVEHDKWKQQLVSQSLLLLIHQEFDHVDWACPLPVNPPRTVVDSLKVEPTSAL